MTRTRTASVRIVAVGSVLVLAGCGATRPRPDGADARLGGQLLSAFGCGGCHAIPGIRDADVEVGPPLGGLAGRRTIAGSLTNTPANVASWVHDPKAVDPATLMPDLGVTRDQARDIAAYLYAH